MTPPIGAGVGADIDGVVDCSEEFDCAAAMPGAPSRSVSEQQVAASRRFAQSAVERPGLGWMRTSVIAFRKRGIASSSVTSTREAEAKGRPVAVISSIDGEPFILVGDQRRGRGETDRSRPTACHPFDTRLNVNVTGIAHTG